MYNPPKFRSNDLKAAAALMDEYPFATMISVHHGAPVISHLPLTADFLDSQIQLFGHMARANPHAQVLAHGRATAIFHGAHTFITPKWYQEDDVPTWNYSAIHITGDVKTIDSYDDMLSVLNRSREHMERRWPSGWELRIPDDLEGKALTRSILVFQMRATDVQFKRKLSQNRSESDRRSVIEGLGARSDENSAAVRRDMQATFLEDGDQK